MGSKECSDLVEIQRIKKKKNPAPPLTTSQVPWVFHFILVCWFIFITNRVFFHFSTDESGIFTFFNQETKVYESCGFFFFFLLEAIRPDLERVNERRRNEEMDAESESSAFKRNYSWAENMFFKENQAPAPFLSNLPRSKHSWVRNELWRFGLRTVERHLRASQTRIISLLH